MTNIKDITGKIYGQLTVVSFSHTDKYGSSHWNCVCQCGNNCVINKLHLKTRNTKSCGCLKRTDPNELVENIYGRLTVIKLSSIDKHGRSIWECKCICGNFCKVRKDSLVRGTTKSCGCLNAENRSIIGSNTVEINSRATRNFILTLNNQTYRFRSSFECIYAEWLNKNNIEFLYEPKIFKIKEGMRYKPDFYLPKTDEYIEVKGYLKKISKEKMELFVKLGYKLNILYQKDILKLLPYNTTYLKYLNKFEKQIIGR